MDTLGLLFDAWMGKNLRHLTKDGLVSTDGLARVLPPRIVHWENCEKSATGRLRQPNIELLGGHDGARLAPAGCRVSWESLYNNKQCSKVFRIVYTTLPKAEISPGPDGPLCRVESRDMVRARHWGMGWDLSFSKLEGEATVVDQQRKGDPTRGIHGDEPVVSGDRTLCRFDESTP